MTGPERDGRREDPGAPGPAQPLPPGAAASFLANSPDGIILTDEEGTLVLWNPAAERITGWAAPQVLGRPLWEVQAQSVPEERRGAAVGRYLEDQIRAALAAGQAPWLGQMDDQELVTPDGVRRVVQVQSFLFQGERGWCLGSVLRDVTAQRELEQSLRQSQGRYQSVSEMTSDFAYGVRVPPDGRLAAEWVTEAHTRITGYTPEEAIRRGDWASMIYPEDLPVAQAQLQEVLSGRPDAREYRLVTKDGQVRWVRNYSRPVWSETEGRVVYIVAAAQDITERKQAEQALRRSEERYRSLAESAADSIYIVDRQGQIEYLNPAAARLIGGRPEELLGRRAADLFAPGTFERQQSNLQRVFESGQPLSITAKTVVGTREIWQDTTLTPLRDESGQVRAVMGASRDVTARMRTAEALRESEALYRTLAESTPDAIAIIGRDGRTEYVNSAAARLVGRKPEELVGRPADEQFAGQEFTRQRRNMQEVLASGRPRRVEARNTYPVGEIWQESLLIPLPGEGNQVRGLLAVARDITERKRAEEALRTSEYQYRGTIDSMGDPIHVVDPELRLILYNQALQRWIDDLHLGPEVIGRSVLELFPFLPAGVREEYEEVFSSGEMLITEETTEVGEREFITETRKIPILEGGRTARVVTVLHDITLRKQAERKLRESEERYRAISQLTSDFAYSARVAPDGTPSLEWLAGAVTRITGFTIEEVQQRDGWKHFVAPEQLGTARAVLQELLANRPIVLEMPLRAKDGTVRWALNYAQPVWDEAQHRVVRIYGAVQDISERREAEAALRAGEARYRAVVEDQMDLICRVLPDWTITFVNAAYCRYFGLSYEQLVGRNMADCLKSDQPEQVWQRTAALSPEHPVATYEDSFHLPSGEVAWQLWTDRAIYDEQGQLAEIQSVGRDITERKRAEEVLWQTKMVVEHSPVILYRLAADAGAPIDFVSENVTLLGYTPAELRSGRLNLLSIVHPDDLQRVLGEVERHTAAGEGAFRQEYRVVCKGGDVRWMENRVVIVRDAGGGVTHYQGVLLDVTETRQLEQQYRQAQKMETVGRLAGGIAHDFNNFLTAIRGYAGLACDALRSDEPVRADVEQILKAAERASSLTGQLLTFSRRQVTEPRATQLNDIILDVDKMIRRLISEEISLELDLASDLAPVWVDPGQVTQALVNLVVNARDAMPDGGTLTLATANVTLDEEAVRELQGLAPGSFVRIAVTDTGVGMSDEVKSHLFEPFFTTKEVGRGTGLGLATVYGVVKQHRGHIVIQSEPGLGTSVWIYLPRYLGEATPRPLHEAARPLALGHETILVVEDEPAVRALMVRVLRRAGYTVLEAADGNEAIHAVREHPGKVDLLLTDVVMPQMDGRVLASLLLDVYADLRVLYVSGYATEVLARHGVQQEGVELLQKPFTGTALAARVRQVLDRAAPAGATDAGPAPALSQES